MKFALLGIDDETLALATALARSGEHALVGFCEVDLSPFAEAASGLAAAISRSADDRPLGSRCSTTAWPTRCSWLAARMRTRRGEQLRKLAQTGRAAIVSHPLCDSMLCYEIDMARADGGAPLMAYLPERRHPAVVELNAWLADQSIGSIEQWLCERPAGRSLAGKCLGAFRAGCRFAACAGRRRGADRGVRSARS